jgi:photosystem II stability/assembly factor-like uncharacterized protein
MIIRIISVSFVWLWILLFLVQNPTMADPTRDVWFGIGSDGIESLTNHDVTSGQVNALAIHPQNADIVYAGASEGGVWKSTDGGNHWTVLTDFSLMRTIPGGKQKATLSIGSLALDLDPTNPDIIIYAGTGDPNIACCYQGAGLGVFRSTDGGITWTPMGANVAQASCQNSAMSQRVVNRIAVRRGTPALVYAATDLGLYQYTEDGSDCWRPLSTGLPSSSKVIDLAIDPASNLYAAIWSEGIFKSTDGGSSWTELTTGLPSSGFGRMALAISPVQSSVLYAGYDANGRYRLFKTATAGTSWDELPNPPNPPESLQLDFNNALAVSTRSSTFIYVGQTGLWGAFDGGTTGGMNDYSVSPPITGRSWYNLSWSLADPNPLRRGLDLHSDLHAITFAAPGSFPASNSVAEILYLANDGGVTRGVINDVGVITWEAKTKGLAIGQCGTVGTAPSNAGGVACGRWHNGNQLTETTGLAWVPVGGGDGFQTTIDAVSDPRTLYYNCNAGSGGGGALCRATIILATCSAS